MFTSKQTSELETLSDIPYRPFVKHLVSVSRKPSNIDASALSDYTKRLQQALNETQQNGGSKKQRPEGGRSLLFKVQPDSGYYS